jgi:hypothetical protein
VVQLGVYDSLRHVSILPPAKGRSGYVFTICSFTIADRQAGRLE